MSADVAMHAELTVPTAALEAAPVPPLPTSPARAFGGFLGDSLARRRTGRVRGLTCMLSIGAHALVLGGGVAWSFWHVPEISPPMLAVRLLSVPMPPPPPPPAARPAAARKPPSTRPVPRPAIVQPREEPPQAVPQEEPEAAAEPQGSDDGTAGGEAGGVAGGVVGSTVSSAPPPPPPPRPAEVSPEQRQLLLQRYLQEILRGRIASRFRYPPEAERIGIEGRVVVRATIDRGGRLVAVGVAGACPHDVLCDAAQRTLRDAAPYPAPPSELGGTVSVEVPLSYKLE